MQLEGHALVTAQGLVRRRRQVALHHSHRAAPHALEAQRSRTGPPTFWRLLLCRHARMGCPVTEAPEALLLRRRASALLGLQLLAFPLPQDAVGAVLGLLS